MNLYFVILYCLYDRIYTKLLLQFCIFIYQNVVANWMVLIGVCVLLEQDILQRNLYIVMQKPSQSNTNPKVWVIFAANIAQVEQITRWSKQVCVSHMCLWQQRRSSSYSRKCKWKFWIYQRLSEDPSFQLSKNFIPRDSENKIKDGKPLPFHYIYITYRPKWYDLSSFALDL